MGLLIPESLLTNSPCSGQNFINCHSDGSAMKVLRQGTLRYASGDVKLLHTRKLLPETICEHKTDAISLAPVFLQEYIPKKQEWRVTVVNDEVFACKIDSQSTAESREDWRGQIFLESKVKHEIGELPGMLSSMCIDFVRRLGLSFGAIDLIETPKEEFYFLEINPNGQWGWIEQITEAPISRSIARLLISKTHAHRP